ncbi:MAG TPA: carboxypeptidase regulatory-like domain-containing protein [Gemmatimonadaceae bacterium]|nr:carboxypeptidase regulatory-like domain-containing protein [Gemmatimonadaceae bacterium]
MRLGTSLSLVAVLAVSTTGAPLFAQQKAPSTPATTAKEGTATIAGIVIDSLNGRFLSGAEVIVQGSSKSLVTDSLGRFRIDSLPPGTYQVGVFHALLDTLGISLASAPFHIGRDSSSFILLAVPSATTIIRAACPVRGFRSQGTSAVIGHVTDPESLQPVAGADVSIAWTQLEVSKEVGVRRTPRVIRDSTDAQGAFKLCGLPNSMKATLQARKAGAVTAEIPIELGDRESELFARTMLLSHADSGAKSGNAVVSGRVVLEGAPSNAGSRVEVVGTDVIAMTNEKGEFSMRNLPSGTHVLLARHLGFGAETVPVDLSSREAKQVTIKLPKFVAMMDPVVVTARQVASLDKVGFSQRQKSGMGYYIGPEQIQSIHPNVLTDVLRRVPSLHVTYGPNGEDVSSSRGTTSLSGSGGCVQYVVDDMPWQSMTPGDVNNFVNGPEVVAVEVYAGPGAPPQYAQGGQDCTTVIIWTKFKIRN